VAPEKGPKTKQQMSSHC